ncbi:conserved hypothetical protein [Listeria ivanovii FSL F6-596]|nr:conserved hypothetical protein [Listeria ivanovii FSL F6-596]
MFMKPNFKKIMANTQLYKKVTLPQNDFLTICFKVTFDYGEGGI